jgi:ParB family transcriptional regulator, chromosome partitioning protein
VTGWRSREKGFRPAVAEKIDMATAKITLSASRDIPFNKLVLSQSNVRRVKAGISIEELAEDICPALASAKPQRPARSGAGG